MIPWPYIWWLSTNHLEPAPVARPPTRHGPLAERAPLDDGEADAFSDLQAIYWSGPNSRRRRLREHLFTLRCYVLTKFAMGVTVLLGLTTIIAALRFDGLCVIPGVIALEGWIVVLLRRRPLDHHGRSSRR